MHAAREAAFALITQFELMNNEFDIAKQSSYWFLVCLNADFMF